MGKVHAFNIYSVFLIVSVQGLQVNEALLVRGTHCKQTKALNVSTSPELFVLAGEYLWY